MTMTPDLLPALPEILLAIGALALLMYGAFAGEKSIGAVTWGAVALLLVALVLVVKGPQAASAFSPWDSCGSAFGCTRVARGRCAGCRWCAAAARATRRAWAVRPDPSRP